MVNFIALVVILLPSYLVRFSVLGVPTTLLEVLIYIGVLWLLFSRALAITFEELKLTFRRLGWPIGLFLASSIIATFIAPDHRVALGLLKGYVLDPILLFFLITAVVKEKKQYFSIANALVVSGLVVAVSAYFGYNNAEGRALGLYIADSTASPNFLALYLAPISILALNFAIYSQQRLAYILSFLAMLVAIILSGSRGGLLASLFTSILSLLVWWYQSSQTRKLTIKWVAILFTLTSVILGYWYSKPNFTPQPEHRVATSNNLRAEIWRTTVVDIIPSKPLFGVGLGNFQNYFTAITQARVNFPQYIAPWARTPHNFVLTIWTNLGLLALLSLVWIIAISAKTILKSKLDQSSLAIGFALLALIIHGLVDAAYWKNDLAALFWILIALCYKTQVKSKNI